MEFSDNSLISSSGVTTILITVAFVIGLVLCIYDKWLPRFYKWNLNAFFTSFVIFVLNFIISGKDKDDKPFLEFINIANNVELGDFYSAGVTLGTALLAALFAAQVVYETKVSKEYEVMEKNRLLSISKPIGNIVSHDLRFKMSTNGHYIKHKGEFGKMIKYAAISCITGIALSIAVLFYSLNFASIVHYVSFSVFYAAIIYSARTIMMSLSVDFKTIF
ncbi:hypothetical protein [Cobetia amphilecti]|uniref:hypothetical protein n=1 Tax=Cobetia amphilecti TaxID=1055104 RepID=UPI00244C09C3|nr:hypothetical protein [Cobetia litoralis]MDH2420602.1 hypothetical protein [Cobetia litoralis]